MKRSGLVALSAIAVAFSASAAKPKKAVAKKAPAKASAVQKAAAPVETANKAVYMQEMEKKVDSGMVCEV